MRHFCDNCKQPVKIAGKLFRVIDRTLIMTGRSYPLCCKMCINKNNLSARGYGIKHRLC